MENKIEIAVTITVCNQIGIDTWQDSHKTKVFNQNSTVGEINDWINSTNKNYNISCSIISVIE